MSKCCGKFDGHIKSTDPTDANGPPCADGSTRGTTDSSTPEPLRWFHDMIDHNVEYAKVEKEKGARVVGIMCEYTPREIIMAAGGLPVCLCGGDESQIPAAEEYLPANLCPLIKSTFGYSVNGTNPFLEMADLLVAETTCDGKKKMYELLAERHPMHVLELTQKPDSTVAFEHWVSELENLRSDLERRFNTRITDDALRDAIKKMNHERDLRRRLAALMKCKNPPLTGLELLELKSLIPSIPADLEQYENALSQLPGRVLDPPGKDRTRVLLTGVPLPHGAERVMGLIEDNGGLVVCQENCTGLKPILEDVDPDAEDPLRAIAKKYFHLPCSVMTKNTGRIDLLRDLIEEYKPDCVVEVIWQTCLTYDIESYDVKKFVESEMNLPYLRIETDYSPSDSARIVLRLQALFEITGQSLPAAPKPSAKQAKTAPAPSS